MYYILEQITNNTKKVIMASDNLDAVKERMSDELHSLNEDILDYEDNVQEIVTNNMVIYAYNNVFYCYRIVEK